jgi:tetratricopeptide (TPR) repeat protein
LTSFSDGGGSSGTSQEAIRSKTGDKQTRPRGGVAWDDQSSGGAPGSHVPRPPSAPMESSRPRPRSRLSQAQQQQQQQHSEMLVIADDDQGVGSEIVDDSSGGDEGQRSEGGSAVKVEVVEEEEGQEKEKEDEKEEVQENEEGQEKEKEKEKEEYQQRIQQTAERLGRTESEDEKWIAEVDAQVAALKAKMAAETSASEKGGSALPHHGGISHRVQYVTEEGIAFARKAMAALDGDSSQEKEAELLTASMEGGWDILCDGRYLEAAEIFTVGLEVNPDETALLANRSAAWLELERYHEAAADAEACYRLQPDDPVSLMRLGTVYMCMGDLRPAMSLFRDGGTEALSLDGFLHVSDSVHGGRY